MLSLTMGVAMDEGLGSVLTQCGDDTIRIDVHDRQRLDLFFVLAALAQRGDFCLALAQRPRQKAGLPGRIAHHAAKTLIVGVVGA